MFSTHQDHLQRGDKVYYNGSPIGTLDDIFADPKSGAVRYLVIKKDEDGREVNVPGDWIREIDGGTIVLNHWDPGHASQKALVREDLIDESLEETFPASDPTTPYTPD